MPVESEIRILIVDDDESICRLLELTMPMTDARVKIVGRAGDGNDAITAARELKPDVILLDHVMPGRSGGSAVPDLRAACPNARIIFFTAYSDAPFTGEQVHQRMKEGNIPLVKKPDLDGLQKAVLVGLT